jgi:hypothetical protein
MAKKKPRCIGCLKHRVQIQRRDLQSSNSDSSEPVYGYSDVFATRAEVTTKSGTNEWNTLVVDGEKISHVMAIRHTRIPFDARDRVRDAHGNLYRIKAVENENERDDWLILYCVRSGHEGIKAAR